MKLRARKVNNFDLFANHAWYVPGVGGMFGLLAWFLVGSFLGSLVVFLFRMFLGEQGVMDYGMLVAYPMYFIPAMIFVAHKSQRNSLFETGYKLNSSHFGQYKWWIIALVTVVLTYAMMIAADLPNYVNYKLTTRVPFLSKLYEMMSDILQGLTGGPFWSSFLLTAIFAPVFEEWLCRGMVLRGLLTKMKPGWAILVSALFFALIHANPWQALNAFIMGVVMGFVYYKTGSLLLTMLIHFVNNGTAVVLSQIDSIPQDAYLFDLMPRTSYFTLYACGVIVLAACLWLFHTLPLEQKRGNIDEIPAQ